MSESVVLFILGVLIGVIQLLTAGIMTGMVFEFRRLRDRLHKVEGAVAFIEGFLRQKGLIDTRSRD